jgi:hypothetical protein
MCAHTYSLCYWERVAGSPLLYTLPEWPLQNELDIKESRKLCDSLAFALMRLCGARFPSEYTQIGTVDARRAVALVLKPSSSSCRTRSVLRMGSKARNGNIWTPTFSDSTTRDYI